jgi:endonuclease-3
MIMKKDNVIKALDEKFPNPKCELEFNHDYELVISTMLSAQTTDKRVNMVMKDVYKKYNTLDKLNNLSISEIEKLISSVGLYKTKAKYFKEITKALLPYDRVPNDRKFLQSIPGVGRKSTNVILSVLYNEPYIAVDTHVSRVSKRFGITKEKDDVLTIENKLYKYFNNVDYKKVGEQLVLYGRYVCTSKKPNCSICPLYIECTSKDKQKMED